MTWTRICLADSVPVNTPVGHLIGHTGADRDRVCVVRRDGESPQAMLDRCPHRDIALSGGTVRDGLLICPGHFWRFSLDTGQRTDRPSEVATLYPTRVVDGWVEADIPPPPPKLSMREWLLSEAKEWSAMRTEPAVPEIGDTIDVNGIATNYHDVGSGDPVLLIHGSGPGVSAWANWRLTMPTLSRAHRVLAPDMLGFGYTERPATANYNLDTWTEHLIGFLDALGLDRVSAVGNSFGGALALSLATRYPSRVGKLVFMGSVGVPFQITPGLDAVWGFEPSVPAMRALLDLFAYDNSLVSDDLARIRLAAATRPGVHEAYQAMFPAPRQASVDAMTLPDEAIAAIRCPTLVIHGREDQVIPLANSKRLHQLIPGSQLQIFDHCGHWVQIEHTAEFNKLIEEFLA